jgi:hypothetical protein
VTEAVREVRGVEIAPVTRSEGLPEQRRWRTADLPEAAPAQVLYRPGTSRSTASEPSRTTDSATARPAVRAEAR